eukprot:3923226-Rhodomonas_salina.1
MPWLALPYSNGDGRKELSSMFEVKGIPSFVMIDPTGKTINGEARGDVSSDLDEGKNFPWAPKPVEEVEALGGSLNESTALLVFAEGAAEETVKQTTAVLEQFAKKAMAEAEAKDEDVSMRFGIATSMEGNITQQIRKLCKLGEVEDGKMRMAILDIPDEGSYYAYEGEVTEEAVRSFLADYEAKKLTAAKLA